MYRIVIDLPEAVYQRLAVRAFERGYTLVDAFATALITNAAAANVDDGPPPEASVRTKAERKALFLKRVQDEGFVDVTPAFLDALRHNAADAIVDQRTDGSTDEV